jgi:hypothetical protein
MSDNGAQRKPDGSPHLAVAASTRVGCCRRSIAIADSQSESQGRLAAVAISAEYKAEFLAAERRWLALAESHAFQQRLSRTVAEFDRRRRAGPITRMLQGTGGAFEPWFLAWRLQLPLWQAGRDRSLSRRRLGQSRCRRWNGRTPFQGC